MKEFVLRGGDTNESALGCDRFSNENFFHLFSVYSELRQSGGWSCSLIPLIFFFHWTGISMKSKQVGSLNGWVLIQNSLAKREPAH